LFYFWHTAGTFAVTLKDEQMKIQIDLDFTAAEKALLLRIFKIKTDAELEAKLTGITMASAAEYMAMILGQKVFTRGKDMQEFRLLNLVKHHFDGQIPTEQEICALFQIRPAEAKGLVNAITSKYQYELLENVGATLEKLLKDLEPDENLKTYKFSLRSAYLKDEINRILFNIGPELPVLGKNAVTGGEFILQPSAYDALMEYIKETKKK